MTEPIKLTCRSQLLKLLSSTLGYEVVTMYDSVTDFGMQCEQWWKQAAPEEA